MLWLFAHPSVIVWVAGLSAPELARTQRRTSAGASSSGGSWNLTGVLSNALVPAGGSVRDESLPVVFVSRPTCVLESSRPNLDAT